MKIPTNFQIIRSASEIIEIKSKYHYWRATRVTTSDKTYLLSHKHNFSDTYHKQSCVAPSNPTTLKNIFKHIKSHDDYIDTLY